MPKLRYFALAAAFALAANVFSSAFLSTEAQAQSATQATNIVVTAGDNSSASLRWTNSTGDGYEHYVRWRRQDTSDNWSSSDAADDNADCTAAPYRDCGDDFTGSGAVASTTITGLTADTRYEAVVLAVGPQDEFHALPIALKTTVMGGAIEAPTNVTTSSTFETITISWRNSVTSGAQHHVRWRANDTGGSWNSDQGVDNADCISPSYRNCGTDLTSASSVTATNLVADTDYNFTIFTTTVAGSPYTATHGVVRTAAASTATAIPATDPLVTAVDDTSFDLRWTNSLRSNYRHYVRWRQKTTGTPNSWISTDGEDNAHCTTAPYTRCGSDLTGSGAFGTTTVTGLTADRGHEYDVIAVGPDGESAFTRGNVNTSPNGGTIAPPTALIASKTRNTITISWTNSVTAGAQHYVRYRANNTGKWRSSHGNDNGQCSTTADINQCGKNLTTESTITFQNLNDATNYYFTIFATTGDNRPYATLDGIIRTGASVTLPPMDVTATASGANVTLTWTRSATTGATHHVRWRAGNSGDWQSSQGADNTDCTASDVSSCGSDQTANNSGLEITGLTAGATYTFGVAADLGSTSSAWVETTARVNNDIAALATLTASGVTLSPTFAAGTFAYTATVPNGTTSTTIAATAQNMGVVSGDTGAQTLSVGDGNVYTITVTAEDGVASQDYTLTITRTPLEMAAPPMDVTATASGTMITLTWTNSITASATHHVRWRAGSSGDWQSSEGADNSDCAASSVLNCGSDQTSSNGGLVFSSLTAGTNYTFGVAADVGGGSSAWVEATTLRHKNRAELATLTLSAGTLSPTFDAATFAYTATVPFGTTTITIGATADRDGTVSGDTTAQTVALGSGNVYTVTATAQDGVATQDYTITVTRAHPTVSDIAITADVRSLVPATFDSAVNAYAVTVGPDPVNTTFTATFTTGTMTIQLASFGTIDPITSGVARSISVGVLGFNREVPVNLVYTEGTETFEYVFTVIQETASDNADLRAGSGNIDPGLIVTDSAGGTVRLTTIFQPDTLFDYTVIVPYESPTITVALFTASQHATFTGDGTYNVNFGANNDPIEIVVTAEDGVATRTYTLTPIGGLPDIDVSIAAAAASTRPAELDLNFDLTTSGSLAPRVPAAGITATASRVPSGGAAEFRVGTTGAFTAASSGAAQSATFAGALSGSFVVQMKYTHNLRETTFTFNLVQPALAPSALTLAGRDEQLNATWSAPTDVGGSALTAYNVQWREAGGTYNDGVEVQDTRFDIAGLRNGNIYDVRVAAVNAAGASAFSAAAQDAAAIRGTPEAPTAPTAVAQANEELTIRWTNPADRGASAITSYRVRWKTTAATDFGSPIQARTMPYALTDLDNNTEYDVQIAAANARGIGVYSATVTATTGVPTAPTAPRALTTEASVVAAASSITVKWQAPADAGSGAVTGYTVDWKLSSAAGYIAANTATVAHDATPLQAVIAMIEDADGVTAAIVDGTSYDIRVTATTDAADTFTTSPPLLFAAVASGAPASAVPSEPRNIKFVASDGSLQVTWEAPVHGTAANYDVRWRKVGAAFAETDILTAQTTQTATIAPVDNGVPYNVEVRANAADDNDPETNEAGAYAAATGTPGALSAPTAPRFLEVAGTNGGLTLQWVPPAEDGGAAVTTYEVRWKLASESRYGAIVDAGNVMSYRIATQTRGAQHDVQVAAVNSIARGLWANLRGATPAGLPSEPRSVQLTPAATSMTVTWRAPESDGGAQLENYVVQWKLASATSYISANVNGTRYTIEERADPVIAALVVDTAYDVRVAATNRFGDVYTDAVQATTAAEAVVPSEPRNVTVENGGATSLRVSWERPTNNGGRPITGYDVSWEDPAFVPPPAPQGTSRAVRATTRTEHTGTMSVGAGATSATISGLTTGTAYTVSVAAKNGVAGDLTQATATPATPAAFAELDDDSSLTALAIGAATLTKVGAAEDVVADGFATDHFAYAIPEVAYTAQTVNITATAAPTASIEIGVVDLTEATSGSAATTDIGVGDNDVRIKVTAEDGSDTIYTVAIARGGPAGFTSLELTGVMLKGDFESNQTNYEFDVAPTLTQVTLKGTFTGAAVIRHSGDPAMGFSSDSVSTPIALNAGTNEVIVTYTEGGISTDYRFTFNAPVSAVRTARIESFLSSAGAAILSSALDVIGDNALNAPLSDKNATFLRYGNGGGERGPRLLSEEPAYRDVDWRDLLGASSFRLALTADEAWSKTTEWLGGVGDALGGGVWSVWGAGDVRGYTSGGDTETEGLGYSGYIGTDYRAKDWLAGVAFGYTTSAGTITTEGTETNADFWLAAAYPYMRYSPLDTVDVWAMAGVGGGTFTLDEPDPDVEQYTADLIHHLYAAGAKAELARTGAFSVAAKTDGSAYFATAPSAEDGEIDVMQQRFRIALDFAYDYKDAVNILRPHLEVGGRFEFGNAEDDLIMGAEVAAGLRYQHLPTRLSIDARARALVYDTSDAGLAPGVLREWGAGATVRILPTRKGLGLSASLTPGWGTPASRVDDMWSNNNNSEFALVDPSNAASLSAELAYTMRHKDALVTPLAQYSLSAAHQIVGVGTRLNLSVLSMELLGEQVNRAATPTDEYRLQLKSKLRF